MTEAVEEWRRLPDAPDYEISDLGRVRSWKRTAKGDPPPRIITPKMLNTYGHKFFESWDHRKRKKHSIHRTVLTIFVCPPEEGQIVRHINGDPGDNRLANLQWGSWQDNSDDRVDHGNSCRGEENVRSKLTERDVELIGRLSEYMTSAQMAEVFRVSSAAIVAATSGRTWHYGA